jgi:hypothetical protein
LCSWDAVWIQHSPAVIGRSLFHERVRETRGRETDSGTANYGAAAVDRNGELPDLVRTCKIQNGSALIPLIFTFMDCLNCKGSFRKYKLSMLISDSVFLSCLICFNLIYKVKHGLQLYRAVNSREKWVQYFNRNT